jgi:hypothetical protein
MCTEVEMDPSEDQKRLWESSHENSQSLYKSEYWVKLGDFQSNVTSSHLASPGLRWGGVAACWHSWRLPSDRRTLYA